MKPDYALSLSLDGIKFMCRVKEGWHLLGQVPLEHADLGGALEKLRKKGEDHAGGKALCKIILPNDQIKYIKLPSQDGDVEAAVTESLESETPYQVSELAYDFVELVDRVQVAAVAKDTLEEALSFAVEHGFDPVSFVAVPDPDDFDAEPFFGATPGAGDLVDDASGLQPDDAPVLNVSSGPLPTEETEPAPAFASRRLTATPEGNGAAKALGGATRGLKADKSEANDDSLANGELKQDESESAVSAQEPRFDPATLIAGLKQRPEPSGETRPRGAARTSVAPVIEDAVVIDAVPPAKASAKSELSDGIKSVQTEPKVGGKPKFLGLILILLLLAFLAGVALWASLFTDDGVAGLFSPTDGIETIPLEPSTADTLETTALPPVSNETITDSAEIEALDDQEGILLDPVMEAALPAPTGDALYAATGIWDRAPIQPDTPGSDTVEAIYIASFEPMQQTHDAIALPTVDSFGVDPQVAPQNNPVAAGIKIDLDERGLVIATADGAISPEGIMVYLGKPASLPPTFPDRAAVQEAVVEEANEELLRLASFRPKVRPTDLSEQNERANLGGSTLSEIASIRPKLRPERAVVELVSIDPSAIQEATDQAVLASIRPKSRPSNFSSTVEKQQERLAAVAVPPAETVAPSIPTTASVARNATQKNAINLRKVNLIGVYGASNDRRALVRLSSGRYKKVQIGDRIDGGRVAAINTSELHYVKGGRTIVLKMPRG
ncbi:hypothetical protein [Cognatishimia activa]|uniref:hypothetical protein n=1 Tax=Cognatishimia activa TaxID=1715691 RepID=UPI00223246B7|nr:hypothetical protein [Cognatishimia activa]UZD91518.1 hypothetical protein M0D42_02545 [Cognatishimia activa]